jgi:dephospho-CoA kinase
MTTDGILVGQIKKEFGTLAYHPDGSLNRTFLGQATFGKKDRLDTLNALVHPRVARDYETWLTALTPAPYVIREAALLYEAGVTASLDRVIVVQAPIPLRVQRVLARDPHRTENEVRSIMESQWPDEEKMKRADDIIVNDESHLVTPQVLRLHHQYLHP